MTLVVLAAAQELADGGDAGERPRLRAVLPVAGMTVIEQQAERASALGADRLLLLVDTITPALSSACDRIRARGLPVELVRNADDVRHHGAAADRLILVADGLIAGAHAWQAIDGALADTVLTTDDTVVTQELERIDAGTRWVGLAVLGHDATEGLDEAPADWDPQLTMLRQAVQYGAKRIAWDSALFVNGDIALATSARSAAAAEQRFLAVGDAREAGIGRRWLIGPLVRAAAAPLLAAQASARIARGAAIVAAVGAIAALLGGHFGLGIALGFAAALAGGVGDFVGRFRPERPAWRTAGGAGVLLQLLALLLAERGAALGSAADLWGSGAMALFATTAVGEAWRTWRGGGAVIDLPIAWLGLGGLTLFAGPSIAAAAMTLIALALLLLTFRRGGPASQASIQV